MHVKRNVVDAKRNGSLRQAEHAFIELKIRTSQTSVFFQISNNYEASGREGEGIGLENLKKRLALIYPNRHQLEITKTEDIYTVALAIGPLEINSDEISNHR